MNSNDIKKTKYELLKSRLTEIYKAMLEDFENDIESGIEEGIYEEKDNVENRALIQEAKQVMEEFIQYKPAIYMYIEGHHIQGISATEGISINKFDTYDYDVAPDEQEMSPGEWEQMIKVQTDNHEIRAIY